MVLLNVISGVCVLLWGLRGVKLGMTKAFGQGLHRAISWGTQNRVRAFLSGIGVTTLLQSSTATAMIVASFTGRRMMTGAAALAVMLGADVGTTLVAQILTFDLSWLMPSMLISGFIIYTVFENRPGRLSHFGKMLIGLGTMLLALSLIKQGAAPLRESDVLPVVLESLDQDPVLLVMIAALLTWLCHSSLAVVLLLGSLAAAQIVPLHVAMAMVLGANLGGVIAPLIATIKDGPEATRVPVGNLLMRLVGVIIILPLLEPVQTIIQTIADDPARVVVNLHMCFNIMLASLFLPFTGALYGLTLRLIPDRPDADDPGRARYLDEKQLDIPAIALSSAGREALRMADLVQSMMEDTIVALRTNDESIVYRIRARDDVLDKLNKAVKLYMAKMARESLDPEDTQQYVRTLTFATNLENVGDTIDKSLMEMALKKIREHKRFSDRGWQEIQDIHNAVLETVRLAQSVFVSNDTKLARRMIEAKEQLRKAEQQATQNHMERIREGVPETIATSGLHLDIIRDYRRINSYMCSVAYPILEEAGLLYGTALKPEKPEDPADSVLSSTEMES
ncbi:MAG: Na/Pi cotransporter family protein [Micavibrio aeruginosavorus]|uniref:Na/Pi cotransporter family protein n=1 Tax=Micavibrio aeruginosavorus TaxID=349221 RepID=A0A7T5R1L9_9BACT|nr:MAG: Na/Pi cotransporter family protein [Micavibrio aeruginosavorus]